MTDNLEVYKLTKKLCVDPKTGDPCSRGNRFDCCCDRVCSLIEELNKERDVLNYELRLSQVNEIAVGSIR